MTELVYCAVLVLECSPHSERAAGLEGIGIEILSLINPSQYLSKITNLVT